jgi:shikimate kinase
VNDPGQAACRPAAAPSVVLVGFMGCGKSHVGKLLSQQLGLPFVDADRLIEEECGPIETIFAEQGEAAFRDLERRVVLTALEGLATSPAVLSLGGGAVGDGDVRAALGAASYVAWLSAPVDVLWRRVRRAARRGRNVRPLARDEGAFRELYAQRLPWYREVATAEFRNDGDRSAAEVAERVAHAIAEAGG